MDADVAGATYEVMDHGAVQDLEPARARRLADHDLSDVVLLSVADHVVGDVPVACRKCDGFAAERLGEPQRVGDAVALFLRKLQGAPPLDVERHPRPMQTIGEPLGVANESRAARVLADAHQDALACRPRPLDGVRLHFGEQLFVHAFGCAPQRELAQRRQVGRREEMLERALGLLGDVDLSFLEPLDQVVGRQIDEFDGVGAVEHSIRDRLAHADMCDLRDHVIEAFDVLDIDRGVDVDAAAHQLFDVEVALRMAAAYDVGMREFIDQNDLRPAGDDGVEVHFLEPLSLVFHGPARNDFQAFQQRFGLPAAVGLDHADDHVVPVLLAGAGLLQHLVGLAHARRCTHEDSELANAALFAARRFEEGFRRGPMFVIAPLIRHR